MKLRELLKEVSNLKSSNKDMDIDISGIAYDSRKVKEGYLFVAIKGEKYDGHDFITEAIKKGAVAVVYEREVRERKNGGPLYIIVKDSRSFLPCPRPKQG